MSGLQLSTGLSGSVVGGLYGPGSTAAAPTRTAVPEGPTTVAQAAYGGGGGDGGGSNSGLHACVIGGLSIAILIFMCWGTARSVAAGVILAGLVLGVVGLVLGAARK